LGLLKYLRSRFEPVFLSDTAFVEEAFRQILNREADPGGLEYYRNVLAQGLSRTWVLIAITHSEEFRRRLAPVSSSLPNLVLERPERYRRTIDHGCDQSILVFESAAAPDFDWLERAIIDNKYYEEPGVWVLDVDFDKRVIAEMIAAFAPARAIELGCAAGAVLECLADAGTAAEGIEISSMAIERAPERVRPSIHHGDLLQLALPRSYDLLFGLDIFEHLNPNKLDAYISRIGDITTDDAYLFCNIPAFGEDAVFGTVFPLYVDGWAEDAAAGRHFSRLHTDDRGYPIHGHLTWADAAWWTRRFEAAGFARDEEVERAFHRKYDGYMAKRSPARRAYFVFGKKASPARRAELLGRIAAPSGLL
jgi:Domain of unknown function (DUF4214)/Methyltransferase domain